MYVRFEHPRSRQGLFSVASDYRHDYCLRSLRMPRARQRELAELLDWLWRHTPAPPAEAYDDWACRCPRTWWDPAAREHIRKAWRVSELLSRHGVRMRPRICREPGRILFSDGVQVVVRPHRENTVGQTRCSRPMPIAKDSWSRDRTTIRRWSRRKQRRCGLAGIGGVDEHLWMRLEADRLVRSPSRPSWVPPTQNSAIRGCLY